MTSLMLPVMLMLVFVYLFGGAIDTGTEYVTYVVPGVILLCAGFGSATTAVTVSQDMTGGIVDRFRSMDVGGPAILAGHVAASVAAQRRLDRARVRGRVRDRVPARTPRRSSGSPPSGSCSRSCSPCPGWRRRSACSRSRPRRPTASRSSIMFLPYASSAFVPVDTMPSWIQGFASTSRSRR